MQIIPLQALPNQEFQVELDNNLWDITIFQSEGVMCATLALNGTTVVEGIRCMSGTPLIPYEYQEDGNFIFITARNQYPAYGQFNQTQFLWYYSEAELAIFRAGSIMFNPIGGQPLRYAPQGYTEA